MMGLLGGAMLQYGYNLGLARILGSEATGNFLFVLSLVSISAIVGQLGIQELLLRYVAAYRSVDDFSRLRGVLVFGLLMGAGGACLLTFVLYVSAPMLAELSGKPILISVIRQMGWLVPPFATIVMAAAALQSAKRMDKVIFIRELGRPLVIVIALIIGFFLLLTFSSFVMIICAFMYCLALLALAVLWYEFKDARSATATHLSLREWLSFSVSVMFLDVFRSTSGWLDTVILGFYIPATDIAIYFAATRTALLITIVLGGFNAILAPMVAELWHKGDLLELNNVFRLATRWTWLAVLPIAVATILVRYELMGIFGKDYTAASTVLLILLLGRTVNGLTGGVGRMLMMTGNQRVEMWNAVVSNLTMLVGMSWAANHYGMLGAAIVSSTVVAVMNIVKLLEVHWLIELQPFDRSYYKLIAAAIAATICGSLLHQMMLGFSPLIILTAVPLATITVYGLVFYISGVEAADRYMVRKILHRTGVL